MKHVQACLSARKDIESSFYHSGGPAEASASLFKCLERYRKQFSLLLRSCEARASLFMCGKGVTSPF